MFLTVAKTKDDTFKLRMTVEERKMLDVLAEHVGLSAADIVRQSVRKQFAELPPKVRAKIK